MIIAHTGIVVKSIESGIQRREDFFSLQTKTTPDSSSLKKDRAIFTSKGTWRFSINDELINLKIGT